MTTKNKPKGSVRIAAKARQVLEFAQQRATTATDRIELSNALFGVDGKATEVFPTESERSAFLRSGEYKRILTLMDTLPQPPVKGSVEMDSFTDETINLRLPRSVHAALLAEAKAEGVSLNQLCAAKLIAQLRTVVLEKPVHQPNKRSVNS